MVASRPQRPASVTARLAPLFSIATDIAIATAPDSQLAGNCPTNARALTVVLKRAGLTADTVRGAIYDDPARGPKPTRSADIGRDFDGHWWVDAQFASTTWTLDLCSELPARYHEPLIMQGTPTEYVPLTRNPPEMDIFDPAHSDIPDDIPTPR